MDCSNQIIKAIKQYRKNVEDKLQQKTGWGRNKIVEMLRDSEDEYFQRFVPESQLPED